jgi:uncharacterized protein YhbP (UPF0306 family)
MNQLEPVTALLQGQNTLVLATSCPDGAPRLAPLFYLPGENLRLYWFSSPASEHSRNLKHNPAAAVSIFRPTDRWKQICGVQMRGTAAVVTDRARRKAVAKAYTDRFQLGVLLQGALSRSRLYEFQPSWLRYIDNSKRFGDKFEISLRPATSHTNI